MKRNRKYNKIVKRIFIGYIAFSIVAIASVCTAYKAYCNDTVETEVKISDEYNGIMYLGERVKVGEGVTEADLGYFYNTLRSIPAPAREYLINSDWTFELGKYFESTSKVEECIGLTRNSEHSIYINVDYMRSTCTIIHEVGHVMYNYAGLKEVLENKGIVDENYHEFGNIELHIDDSSEDYAHSNMKELTATMFYEYCLYPDNVRVNAPTVYEAYAEAMNNL